MSQSIVGDGTIVVVDDDRAIGSLLQRVLGELAPGYAVVFAAHGAAALAHVEAGDVSLVITDYILPDMNGVAVTQAIKARSPRTAVLALSGMPSSEVQQAFHVAGAALFLAKPMRLSELAVALRQVLGAGGLAVREDAGRS